ncbi:hypothetical protein DLD99_01780 [Pseudomonas kribbensis]|uniref:Uncharacterized protein n=1 Tax=Pseudomonas kribbensis TaxID=1628086 RepID=A0A345RIY0_9PSED|nr:hypothetical protein [Pseudomonas kribbensis]AXI59246.1 hypothetical protein DLD99_01780 [Pseudomonas kribbensis]
MTDTPNYPNQNALSLTATAGTTESEDLTNAETLALAQFIRRVGWFEFSAHAGSDEEAHLVKQAVDKLQTILSRSGYDPH